jgi:hypothetical protein
MIAAVLLANSSMPLYALHATTGLCRVRRQPIAAAREDRQAAHLGSTAVRSSDSAAAELPLTISSARRGTGPVGPWDGRPSAPATKSSTQRRQTSTTGARPQSKQVPSKLGLQTTGDGALMEAAASGQSLFQDAHLTADTHCQASSSSSTLGAYLPDCWQWVAAERLRLLTERPGQSAGAPAETGHAAPLQ